MANPKIKTLKSEIYKLNKDIEKFVNQSGQDQWLMIQVIDGNGYPINLSILSVSGLPSTIEEIEGIVGGRSKKKPKHTI